MHYFYIPQRWNKILSSQVILGVLLDPALNWTNHEVMRTIYVALIHSHLSYGITLWGNSSSVHRVFSSQKAAVRIIDGAKNCAHCHELLLRYIILPIPCMYIFETVLSLHRSVLGMATHSDVHRYNTRGTERLIVPYFR